MATTRKGVSYLADVPALGKALIGARETSANLRTRSAVRIRLRLASSWS